MTQGSAEIGWVVLGLTAQAVFAMRFVWQWIVSERRGESVIPVGFWYFSLVGGVMLTVYAVFRDPVLIPGQAAGLVIYVRNLMLIHGGRASERANELSRAAPHATLETGHLPSTPHYSVAGFGLPDPLQTDPPSMMTRQ